jgi:hypothetical protein
LPNATKRQVEAWWYVLQSERDKPQAEQSRFLLKPLTQAERMRVWDDSSWVAIDKNGSKSITARGFQQAHELCMTNIEEVQNFPLDGPKLWPKSKPERLDYLALLDDMDVFEIGNAVREKSTLEPEAKNS